jgi:threonine synthase
MIKRVRLRCRVCGAEREPARIHYCEECLGPLEVALEPPAPGSFTLSESDSLRRYAAWLPLPPHGPELPRLPRTPLLRAERLGRAWGLSCFYLKDETVQPSGSFKDRLVSLALLQARAFGLDTVLCASTGNLARSVAQLAPSLGLTAHLLVPESVAASLCLPGLIGVRGTYDQANRLAIEVAQERGWGVVNVDLHPFYAQGGKTVGHEIAEQLGSMPRHLICCMAGGSLIGKVYQGLQEMAAFARSAPAAVALHGAQAAGSAPIVTAFQRGSDEIVPVQNPQTRVHSLAVGDPGDGFFALQLLRQTGGTAWAIDDDEAQAAAGECREAEGLASELAGGVALAAAKRLAQSGKIARDEPVVVVLTGRAHTTTVTASPHPVIEPTREAFRRLLP